MSSISIEGDLLIGLTFLILEMRQNWLLYSPQKKTREVRKSLML